MNPAPQVGDRVRILSSSLPSHVGHICIVERVFEDGVMLRIPEVNPFLYHPNDNQWYFEFSLIELVSDESSTIETEVQP